MSIADTRIYVFHASENVKPISAISFPGPRDNCDFGFGFYLAEDKQTAEEWVVDLKNPVVNTYTLTYNYKNILRLEGRDWIRVIVGYRTKKYKVKFKSPIIYGPIADDRMVTFLGLFMEGLIGDLRLLKGLDYCKLGNQYLLRESSECLSNHSAYVLKGSALKKANERHTARRKNMREDLIKIQREPMPKESFIEDYLKEGDYIEI